MLQKSSKTYKTNEKSPSVELSELLETVEIG